jgi:hypothetical protein
MLIGIDFDNTIVSYDSLFHRVALEQGLIPADTPKSKEQVRNYLRRVGREDDWTELQGYVYGARICEASAFPGVVEFIRACHELEIPVRIVSHKTRFPFRGPSYDLHQAALKWLDHNGLFRPSFGLPQTSVFLETTLADKLFRIGQQQCTHFIDDLPELLAEPAFPAATQRWLFDPHEHHPQESRFARVTSWSQLHDQLLCEARVAR